MLLLNEGEKSLRRPGPEADFETRYEYIHSPRYTLTRDFVWDVMSEELKQKDEATVMFREDFEKIITRFNEERKLTGPDGVTIQGVLDFMETNHGDEELKMPEREFFLHNLWIACERYKKGFDVVFLEEAKDQERTFSVTRLAFFRAFGRNDGLDFHGWRNFFDRERIGLDLGDNPVSLVGWFLNLGYIEYNETDGKFRQTRQK